MFFNFCNYNDGRTWSTPFVIDDPRLYVVESERVVQVMERKKQAIAQRSTKRR